MISSRLHPPYGSQIVNEFTTEFNHKFVTNGKIDWESLVKFNSGNTKATAKP